MEAVGRGVRKGRHSEEQSPGEARGHDGRARDQNKCGVEGGGDREESETCLPSQPTDCAARGRDSGRKWSSLTSEEKGRCGWFQINGKQPVKHRAIQSPHRSYRCCRLKNDSFPSFSVSLKVTPKGQYRFDRVRSGVVCLRSAISSIRVNRTLH